MRGASFVCTVAIVAIVAAVGCYQAPRDAPCTVSCAGQTATCPSGLVCQGGICASPGGGCGGDAGVDVDAPNDVGMYCYGHAEGPLQVCRSQPPSRDETIPDGTEYEFVTGGAGQTGCTVVATPTGEICLVEYNSLTIPTTTRLVGNGSRPLVFLVAGHLKVDGVISVGEEPGNLLSRAGAASNACGTPGTPAVTMGAGGGAGGSFGGPGGGGGTGNGGDAQGGSAAAEPSLDRIRGGCPGQGGAGNPVDNGGRAGGAVYFIVGTMTVTATGSINASGGPGGGGTSGGGGGGGGAGGLIGIDVAQGGGLMLSGTVFANGGAGGGGASVAGPGMAGTYSTGPIARGLGGSPGVGGGSGGAGTGGLVLDGSMGAPGGAAASGGGGGGGAGHVLIYPATENPGPVSSIAPPPTSPAL